MKGRFWGPFASLILGRPGSPAHDVHSPHVAAEMVSTLLQARFQSKRAFEFPPMSTSENKGRRQPIERTLFVRTFLA